MTQDEQFLASMHIEPCRILDTCKRQEPAQPMRDTLIDCTFEDGYASMPIADFNRLINANADLDAKANLLGQSAANWCDRARAECDAKGYWRTSAIIAATVCIAAIVWGLR